MGRRFPRFTLMSGDADLSRREFTKLAAAAALTGSRFPVPGSRTWPGYARAIVIDSLASPTHFNVSDSFDHPLTAAMVENARRSGITAVNVTVSGGGDDPFGDTINHIAYCERELDAHPDVFARVRSVADIRRAKETGRVGLIYGFQDATMLGTDLERVNTFKHLGVRIIQLTYNRRNLLGDGCLEEANAGLSAWGRAVIGRMNELGMLVDLSHCGQQTTLDALEVSTRPVAVTHSGCQAVNPVPRNKTDAQLKLLAERGGVIGIYLMPFLRPSGQPNAGDFLKHVAHALQVCGEDHVGIGSDLSITPLDLTPEFRKKHADFATTRMRLGIAAPGEAPDVFNYVPDFNTPRRLDQIADALANAGHSSARIEKIIGGNWLRLFGEIWR
jgi:membrane dipeptidase